VNFNAIFGTSTIVIYLAEKRGENSQAGESAWQSTQLTACQEAVTTLVKRAQDSVNRTDFTAITCHQDTSSAIRMVHHTTQTLGVILPLLGFSNSIVRTFRISTKKNKKKNKEKESGPVVQVCILIVKILLTYAYIHFYIDKSPYIMYT